MVGHEEGVLRDGALGVDLRRDDVHRNVLQDSDDGREQAGPVGGLDVELRVRARRVLGERDLRADRSRSPGAKRRQRVVAVAAARDVQAGGVLGGVAAAVAPGKLGGGLRVVFDEFLENGDADLLDAGGLDDLDAFFPPPAPVFFPPFFL